MFVKAIKNKFIKIRKKVPVCMELLFYQYF